LVEKLQSSGVIYVYSCLTNFAVLVRLYQIPRVYSG
jgi:hypothetical protein